MPLITPHPGKLGAGNKGCETGGRIPPCPSSPPVKANNSIWRDHSSADVEVITNCVLLVSQRIVPPGTKVDEEP